MKIKITTLIGFFLINYTIAQSKIGEHTFSVSELSSITMHTFLNDKIKDSQFIMLGEQHGIKEVGAITNVIYNLAYPFGYNTLCIETSPFAADILSRQFSSSEKIEDRLKKIYQKYPFSIPFYNNKNDVDLFNHLKSKKGNLWGIDQTFMVEFRLVFDYLTSLNENEELREAVKPLLKQAVEGYKTAIKDKDYMAPFIFKYSDELHEELMVLTKNTDERRVLEDLKLTKEIYTYNFQKQYYLNNNERAKLMKRNFLKYYDDALQVTPTPKVLFKLGANHVGKGLTPTNVFDISNLVSELAVMNDKTSVHMYATGINGMQNLGNPFAPVTVVPFDNLKKIPEEVAEVIKTHENKYIIIDAERLREKANDFSDKMKNLVLTYDVLIYIRDCQALESFE